ncbi:MAG: type II toxin-antitoxin system ParD family antitoxin [Burkholderiaceae bacterium]|nr:type II toxin-antitoxin system ParD family antitoxin [Burkholderiaceae bacterium]
MAVVSKEAVVQSMNISLPDPLKQFVDGQISTGRYSSASGTVVNSFALTQSARPQNSSKQDSWKALNGAERVPTSADWSAIRTLSLSFP